MQTCLAALAAQTYPQERFEVVVVNNDPMDPPPDFHVQENVLLAEESKPGSYAARNRGLALARGEIIAFTDADCVPTPTWLESAVRMLLQGHQRLAGRVELFYRGERLSPAELHEREFAFDQRNFAEQGGTAATANMIAWRAIFDKVGGFDEHLLSGGDMEWGWRAQKAGFPIVYAPSVVVRHPARHSVRELWLRQKRIVAFDLYLEPKRPSHLPLLVAQLRPPVRLAVSLLRRGGMNLREVLTLSGVFYLLRLCDTYHKVLHCLGLYRPTRT